MDIKGTYQNFSFFQNYFENNGNSGFDKTENLSPVLIPPDMFINSPQNGNQQLLPNINIFNPATNQINGKVMGIAGGTGYFPDNSPMEGGYHDKKGKDLCTLQDYLNGKAPYVSIAFDKYLYKNDVIKYGDKFRIPELEAKYGRYIEFRAVDTGNGFTGKGFNRVDICTRSRKDSLDGTINGKLTLVKI